MIDQKVLDKILPEMKKNMTMKLTVGKDYLAGAAADTCTCELTLKEMYETSDVSFSKDGSVSKKTIRQGEGYEKASQEGISCTMKFTAVTDGGERALMKDEQEITFNVGDGEVSDALECIAASMKKGEK